MTIEDGVATIEDIDKGAATVTVAPAQPPVGEAPASNPADSAPAIQAETPAVPSDEGPADAPAQEPKKFQESSEYRRIQRQRANAERRALRAEAELEALKGNHQPQPAPQARVASEQPKASDFASYDDFVRHLAVEAAKTGAREVVSENQRAQAQGDAAAAAQQARTAFEREAAAQAKAAGIDFADAWETLLELPKEDVSEAFAVYLYQAADNKAALVDHFAKNPDEVARISSLHPAAQFKELAKVDLQMGTKPRPPATKAPPIGPTVGGRGITQKSVKDMDMDQFADHFMAEQEARLKRM
jgi:hypothetical protein